MRIFAKTLAVCALAITVTVVAAAPSWAQFPSPQQQQPAQPPVPPAQPAPQPPAPYAPQPPADPRVERIRAALQQRGLRVYEVGFQPPRNNNAPFWYASAAANYSQPSRGSVMQQAFDMWGTIYSVISQDPPQTAMLGLQIWTKYGIGMITQVGSYTDLLNKLRSAPSQGEKDQALNAFLSQIQFRVMDLERRQFVDQQDFINKNFAR